MSADVNEILAVLQLMWSLKKSSKNIEVLTISQKFSEMAELKWGLIGCLW